MAHMALGARLLRQELIRGSTDSVQAPFPLGAVCLTTSGASDLPTLPEQYQRLQSQQPFPTDNQQRTEPACAVCRETWTCLHATSSPIGLSSSNEPLTALCCSTLWQSSSACNLTFLAGDSVFCGSHCAPLASCDPDTSPHAELGATVSNRLTGHGDGIYSVDCNNAGVLLTEVDWQQGSAPGFLPAVAKWETGWPSLKRRASLLS